MRFEFARLGAAPLTRGLLRCGVAAGPLFVTVFLAEGARRAGYKPLRHPVSSLSLGPHGWVQVANFSAAGTLCLAAAAGLSRTRDAIVGTRLGPALIGAAGLGCWARPCSPPTRSAATHLGHPTLSPSRANQ
jgi:hypothetical protein